MDVTLQQIKSFLAVARYASFTQAARVLNLSQPALTAQIKRLETGLKTKLFDRSTLPIRVTQAGLALIPIAQRAFGALEVAMTSTRKAAIPHQDVIRLACLPTFAASVLPVAIAALAKTFPSVSLILKDVESKQGIAMVRSEDVECGVTLDQSTATDLNCTPLLDDEMRIVYPVGHPIGRVRQATLEVVSEYPLILLGTKECESRIMIDAALVGATTPAIEVAYIPSALAMVKAGLGIAIIPSVGLNILKSNAQLRCRRIDGGSLTRRISIVTKRGIRLSPIVQNFIKVLVAESRRHRLTASDQPKKK